MAPDSTVADEVADLRAILSCLQGPFVLVGWSYGGLLASEAAIGRTDITSLILYEPVCRPFVPTAVEPIRRAVAAGDLDRAVTLIVTTVGGAPAEQMAAMRDSPAWEYFKPLARPAGIALAALNQHSPDFAGYAQIGAPITLLIGARNEDVAPYGEAANRFLGRLPNATKIILAGQGHLAHVEDPVSLAEAIDAAIVASK